MSKLMARKVFELDAEHVEKYEKEREKTGLSHAAFIMILIDHWIRRPKEKA